MLFMVIERFKSAEAATEVYRRFEEKGRLLPEGLNYVDSWVDAGFERCFQLMETEDRRLFDQWRQHWEDLVDFEIIPVLTSKEAARRSTTEL